MRQMSTYHDLGGIVVLECIKSFFPRTLGKIPSIVEEFHPLKAGDSTNKLGHDVELGEH